MNDSQTSIGAIREALRFAQRFAGRTIVVVAPSDWIQPAVLAADLLLLRTVGIRVVVLIDVRESGVATTTATKLREQSNLNGLRAVIVYANELEGPSEGRHGPEGVGGAADTIDRLNGADITPIICSAGEALWGQARDLAVALSAAKLLVLLPRWDHTILPIGGPGESVPPRAGEIAAFLDQIPEGMRSAVRSCIDAAESGVDECHLLPATDPDALLLEVFTNSGVSTWMQG